MTEVLQYDRKLSIVHIKAWSTLFQVDPSAFIERRSHKILANHPIWGIMRNVSAYLLELRGYVESFRLITRMRGVMQKCSV